MLDDDDDDDDKQLFCRKTRCEPKSQTSTDDSAAPSGEYNGHDTTTT